MFFQNNFSNNYTFQWLLCRMQIATMKPWYFCNNQNYLTPKWLLLPVRLYFKDYRFNSLHFKYIAKSWFKFSSRSVIDCFVCGIPVRYQELGNSCEIFCQNFNGKPCCFVQCEISTHLLLMYIIYFQMNFADY